MRLEDTDKLAKAKRELEEIAALEQRARKARKLGVTIASAAARGVVYGENTTLVEPTDDEEFVEEVRTAMLNRCARRRRDLRATLEGFGVEVADA